MNKIKTIWAGTENEPVKVWENGKVLDEGYFAIITDQLKEVLSGGEE